MSRSAPDRETAAPAGDEYEKRYQWEVLAVAVVGSFMSALSQTTVNLAIKSLQRVFNSPLSTVQWVLTGYLLALAVGIPVTGWLADRVGIKRIYLSALAAFALASLLCGLAPNVQTLIAFRVVQGLGGAALQPLGLALIYQAWPDRQRGTATAFFGLPVLLAPVLGPTVGGYMVEDLDWRLIFLINVPIGAGGLLLGLRLLRERRAEIVRPFDLPGAVFSAAGLAILLYGLSQAGSDGWGSPTVLGCIAAGIALLVAFCFWELRTPAPLLDLRLYGRRVFISSSVVAWITYISLIGGQFLVPLYLQNIRGRSPIETGLLLLPQGISLMIALPIAGRLYDRIGPRPVVAVGLAILGAATYWFAKVDASTSLNAIRLGLLARGFGLGLAYIPLTTAALSVARGDELPRASSLFNVMSQVAGSFGVAILATYLAQHSKDHIVALQSGALADGSFARQLAEQTARLMRSGMPAGRAHELAHGIVAGAVQVHGVAQGYGDTFTLASAVVIPALVLASLLPGRRLHRRA